MMIYRLGLLGDNMDLLDWLKKLGLFFPGKSRQYEEEEEESDWLTELERKADQGNFEDDPFSK